MTKYITNNALVRYLRESKEELAKVTWPTRRETNKYALTVVLISVLIGVFFFVLDIIFNTGLSALINLAS
ncbi:MAG: Protein translocase subunit secE/sec61 gamma [Candidatus Giovannonibacteria bacterium GW2011_GWA2_53_7]|uniref:Protein translocase subunit SecE n=1 Tax=Candidatus Giovannonibacteria bacterium GW2011_GWA2_53_7 TaxID=1618650 RepID=A0A0G1Y1X4_9BACT|nr:MAG: Protein translocase subunit secE/sec61 gamma [Candidatus Giovannonibacteria bacterium GW2011_GWA2_53_7]